MRLFHKIQEGKMRRIEFFRGMEKKEKKDDKNCVFGLTL